MVAATFGSKDKMVIPKCLPTIRLNLLTTSMEVEKT